LEYRARVHRRVLQLDAALEVRGLIDRRGKLRVAWISKLESLITTARALDGLLGLGRRAKQLPPGEEIARFMSGEAQDDDPEVLP
jgi:hypothetical protein